jgi:hypothetical protein
VVRSRSSNVQFGRIKLQSLYSVVLPLSSVFLLEQKATLLCLRADQSEFMDLFDGFNLLSVANFIFPSLVAGFRLVYSYFPVTTRGLDRFSCAYLNKLRVSMVLCN